MPDKCSYCGCTTVDSTGCCVNCGKNLIAQSVYKTKDSGKRMEFASGMVRDTEEGKVRYALLLPPGLPREASLLIRWAELLTRGAVKYNANNWLLADGQAELDRARSSLWRHFIQYDLGETDEDHAAAVLFNLQQIEYIKSKMRNKAE